MGWGLGQKISKGINNLGNKAHNVANTLGQKSNGLLKQVKNTANMVHNEALDVAKEVNRGINKIDNQAALAIKKSGAVTDGLRQGANYLNQGMKAVNNIANATGLSNVPILGQGLAMAGTAANQLNKGADKLDKMRDRADLERKNLRKKYDDIKNTVKEEYNNFKE